MGRAIVIALLLVCPHVFAQPASHEVSYLEAVRETLANRDDVVVSRLDVAIAATDIAVARAAFIPRLIVDVRGEAESQAGTARRFEWQQQNVAAAVELAGRLRTGMTYSVGVRTGVDRETSPWTTIYSPTYATRIGFSLAQPLLRGAWRAANVQPIVVASRRRDVTAQQLRVRVEAVVGEVAVAYWTLALAYKAREAREASLKLAEDQLKESTRLVRHGTLSELDIVDAQAGVIRRQQELVRADRDIAEAEGALRRVTLATWAPADVIVPSDPADTAPTATTIEEQLEIARKNRPDVAAVRALVDAEAAALEVTRNGLRPQLDLVASGGIIGFSGALQDNYATLGVGDGTLMPPFVPDPSIDGGPLTSLRNLAVGGNYLVSLGLRLELPLQNTAAEAQHEKQRLALARAKASQRALLARIESEVRTSVANLQADERIQKIADDAVAANERLLAGMRKRFASGEITSFDVLRVADALTQSQIDAARARVNYRVSLARLAAANGTLLSQTNIDLDVAK